MLIKPYKGESDDCELTKIANFLEELADKPDVRPVMDNFINYELCRVSDSVSGRKVGTCPKTPKSKFIQGNEKLVQLDPESSDEETSSECDLVDVDESCEGDVLALKVPTLKPLKKVLLDMFEIKLNADISLEARDYDKSTEDSAEESRFNSPAKRNPNKKTTAESTSNNGVSKLLDTQATELSLLIEKLPSMTPNSQFFKLKSSLLLTEDLC